MMEEKILEIINENAGTDLDLAVQTKIIDDELIELINNSKLVCPEQDALCIICAGNIMDMPSDFNRNNYTVATQNERIRHHCGYRHTSWAGFPDVNQFRRLSWDEVMKNYENH